MRTEFAALLAGLALAGCASAPTHPVHAPAAQADACSARTCALPAEVRAFIEDRDLCEHFRGEPWPEGDSAADRARRRELMDGVRTSCAGSEARLAALRSRYATDAVVMAALAGYAEQLAP